MKAAAARALLVTLIPFAVVSAQDTPRDDTVPARGIVVDEAGAPVPAVNVSVHDYRHIKTSVRSAADGSFPIDVLRRTYDGSLLLAQDDSGDRLGTLVNADQRPGDERLARIVLRKAHKLDVTVTDAQGQLVTGARVDVIYRQ